MKPTLPKVILKKVMKRFLKDRNRGISVDLFAQLAGVSVSQIKEVFLYESEPLSEYVQRRVSKAYTEWQNGEVAVMQNKDNTRFLQYRKESKPVLRKTTRLNVVNGQIRLDIGVKNRFDYSYNTLDEQLKGDQYGG